jgi:hypothetical protein
MVAYTGIQGQNILIVSSDPSNPVEGQIWYNSTSNLLKVYQFADINSFATGGTMGTARYGLAAAGTQTATVAFGGGSPYTGGATELYNGTSWTSNPTSMSPGTYTLAGAGTQTAALAFGGKTGPGAQSSQAQKFGGSSWTTTGSLGTARYTISGAGLQTAALAFGGVKTPGEQGQSATESFNGTSWTAVNSMNTARGNSGGCGTQTAALVVAGTTFPSSVASSAVESWNGTSWTSGASYPISKGFLASFGTQTSSITCGGLPTVTTTNLWNGTAWTANPTGLATGRGQQSATGTATAGLIAGGSPPNSGLTEEWTGVALATRTITVS